MPKPFIISNDANRQIIENFYTYTKVLGGHQKRKIRTAGNSSNRKNDRICI